MCAFVAAAAVLAVFVQPARACSCVPPDPRSMLVRADGAFVGRLESRREVSPAVAVLTFRVERVVKGPIGDTVEVETSSSGDACGIETQVGARIGLFLERMGDRWAGSLCWQVDADALLAAGRPLPAPDGHGPVALIVSGRWGPARLIALDVRGRTLAYGNGAGNTVELSVCPDRQRVVERFLSDRGENMIAVRDLRTLRVTRRQRLTLSPLEALIALRCLNRAGSEVGLFASGVPPDDRDRARIALVTPQRASTIWRGSGFAASLTNRFGYVNALVPSGTKLVTVDLTTGKARALGPLPPGTGPLVSNASGTRLAGIAYGEKADPARLVVVDIKPSSVDVRSVPLGAEIFPERLYWLPGGRLAYAPYEEIRVYSSSLRLVARIPGWYAGATALRGTTAFGVANGRIVKAQLPRGLVQMMRRLPSPTARVIVAVG